MHRIRTPRPPIVGRGGFQAEPDGAGAAFRHGLADLKLEDGSSHRVTMLGHTSGSDTTYFEFRR